MGQIRIIEADSLSYIMPVEAYPDDVLPMIPDAELEGTRVKMHHPGGPNEPQLFEVQVDPNLELAAHAHESDEIIAVVEGELRLGARVCGPGSSLMVGANTLYSLQAGPEGARFFNFRGAADYTYVDKAGFVARRTKSP